MREYFNKLSSIAKTLTITSNEQTLGRIAKGFIQLMDRDNTDNYNHQPVGILDDRRYLIIAEAAAFTITEGDISVFDGDTEYSAMHVEPVYLGKKIGHWEGVLKLKNGGST